MKQRALGRRSRLSLVWGAALALVSPAAHAADYSEVPLANRVAAALADSRARRVVYEDVNAIPAKEIADCLLAGDPEGRKAYMAVRDSDDMAFYAISLGRAALPVLRQTGPAAWRRIELSEKEQEKAPPGAEVWVRTVSGRGKKYDEVLARTLVEDVALTALVEVSRGGEATQTMLERLTSLHENAAKYEVIPGWRIRVRFETNHAGHVAFPWEAEVTIEKRENGRLKPVNWYVPIVLEVVKTARDGRRLNGCYGVDPDSDRENAFLKGVCKDGRAKVRMYGDAYHGFRGRQPLMLTRLGDLLVELRHEESRVITGQVRVRADPQLAKKRVAKALQRAHHATYSVQKFRELLPVQSNTETFTLDRIAEITACPNHMTAQNEESSVFIVHPWRNRPRTSKGLSPVTGASIARHGPAPLLASDQVLMGPHDIIHARWIEGSSYRFVAAGGKEPERRSGRRALDLDRRVGLYISPSQPTDWLVRHLNKGSLFWAAWNSLRAGSPTRPGVVVDAAVAGGLSTSAGLLVAKVGVKSAVTGGFLGSFALFLVQKGANALFPLDIVATRLPGTVVYYRFGDPPRVFLIEGKAEILTLEGKVQHVLEPGQAVSVRRKAMASELERFELERLPRSVQQAIPKTTTRRSVRPRSP